MAPEPDEPPPPEQLPATGADPPAPVPEQVTVLRTEQQELVADLPPEEGEDADVVAAPDADDEELQPMAALSGSAPNATETPAVTASTARGTRTYAGSTPPRRRVRTGRGRRTRWSPR